MQVRTHDEVPTVEGRRLSPGLWVAAGAEIVVAFVVATIILRTGQQSSHDDMPDMPGMSQQSAQIHWHVTTLVLAALTAAMLAWWLASRAGIPAVVTAVGLVAVTTSEEVRTIAVQSHLVAMAALEALLVAGPLLLISALWARQSNATASRSPLWTAAVVVAVILNSALLIALHLPAVHDRGMDLAMVPLWLVFLVVVTGLAYWTAVLLTTGRVGAALRRGALIVGQEVAAILGLAAVIRPSTHLHHTNPLGLSQSVDQRLGGVLMLVTCAAVTLPLAKRLEQQQRMELDVH